MRLRVIGRLLQIQRVLVRHGLDEIILATHLFRPLRYAFYLSPATWFERRRGGTRGERIRLALEELGPIFVKFGQALSTRRDLLPADVADELEKLQDRVPPFPGAEARAIAERAYGRPLAEVFESFDEQPLAAASIAQVHVARLRSGEEVVVKVIRPNIREAIERDLEVMYVIAGLAREYATEGHRLPPEKYRYHDHVKLAHYAKEACDIEFEFPIGFKEVEGIHSRGDYDLSQHQIYSRKKLQYFDNDIDEATGKPYGNYVPNVVETSIGLDRMFLLILSHAYDEETITREDGTTDSRVVLHIPPRLAPIKLAILPLTKKDGLPEIARDIMKDCREEFYCFYEEKDAIGKRYRRMDAIGTPFCITVDHQTKEDNTVTIRYRDTMAQERLPISRVKDLIKEKIR